MSTLVVLSLPGSTLALGRVLEDLEDLEVELERVVPTGGECCPFVWVRSPRSRLLTQSDLEQFERAARSESVIERIEATTRQPDRTLYRLTWDRDEPGFFDAIEQTSGTVLEATGTAKRFTIRLRFPDADAISAFQEWCMNREIPLELTRIQQFREEHGRLPSSVTSGQTEALLEAYQQGYFDRPRTTSLEEVAETLEVTPQAAGGRIQRGISNVLGDVLPVAARADHHDLSDEQRK